MFVSRNGGEDWSCPVIVNDTWLDDRDAGITYLGNGRMLLSYFHHPKGLYSGEWRSWIVGDAEEAFRPMVNAMLDAYSSFSSGQDSPGSFVRLSRDYGRSWEAPVQVPVSAPHGAVKTASGRLLYLGKEFHSGGPDEDRGQILLYESTDGGQTWERRSRLSFPQGCGASNMHEPHLTELPDGRLIAAIRGEGAPVYHNFTMYFAVSEDGGNTWSLPAPSRISGSPPHLLLLSDGSVLCTYGRREAPFGIRAVVSRDGCRSFGEEMILSDSWSGDLGYPATAELADGALVTVCYQRCGKDSRTSILYTKWRLSEFKSNH